ncbi:hypothetical protein HHL22_09925 [Hymenobacter sp. RP-2-7]|uniref:Uncharacterized protein n=1 Tax=Hymenobacter polaris TaxID=2682546 RepID=A0A7Y0FMG8_9BACT|nr:hypothetical protein [Hymenobacter polaris]NML65521.1 hypothetical protein [Hymenobacter polaris]
MEARPYFHRRELPDVRRTYAYSATDRAHGLRILMLGVIVFNLGLYLRLAPRETAELAPPKKYLYFEFKK